MPRDVAQPSAAGLHDMAAGIHISAEDAPKLSPVVLGRSEHLRREAHSHTSSLRPAPHDLRPNLIALPSFFPPFALSRGAYECRKMGLGADIIKNIAPWRCSLSAFQASSLLATSNSACAAGHVQLATLPCSATANSCMLVKLCV